MRSSSVSEICSRSEVPGTSELFGRSTGVRVNSSVHDPAEGEGCVMTIKGGSYIEQDGCGNNRCPNADERPGKRDTVGGKEGREVR